MELQQKNHARQKTGFFLDFMNKFFGFSFHLHSSLVRIIN